MATTLKKSDSLLQYDGMLRNFLIIYLEQMIVRLHNKIGTKRTI